MLGFLDKIYFRGSNPLKKSAWPLIRLLGRSTKNKFRTRRRSWPQLITWWFRMTITCSATHKHQCKWLAVQFRIPSKHFCTRLAYGYRVPPASSFLELCFACTTSQNRNSRSKVRTNTSVNWRMQAVDQRPLRIKRYVVCVYRTVTAYSMRVRSIDTPVAFWTAKKDKKREKSPFSSSKLNPYP